MCIGVLPLVHIHADDTLLYNLDNTTCFARMLISNKET